MKEASEKAIKGNHLLNTALFCIGEQDGEVKALGGLYTNKDHKYLHRRIFISFDPIKRVFQLISKNIPLSPLKFSRIHHGGMRSIHKSLIVYFVAEIDTTTSGRSVCQSIK